MQEVTDPNLLARLNGSAQQGRVIKAPNQRDVRKDVLDIEGKGLGNQKTAEEIERDRRNETRTVSNDKFTHVTKLAGDYNADPAVKAYRVAIGQMAQALGTGSGPQADLALTYAFAKAMDPDSVVRESEQGMVTSSQPWFKAAVENTKKQFGMDGAGNYTPETREALRRQIANSVTQRVKLYDARRDYYAGQAQHLGVPTEMVVGEHDAKPFVPALEKWGKQREARNGGTAKIVDQMVREGRPYEEANALAISNGLKPIDPKAYNDRLRFQQQNPNSPAPNAVPPQPDGYAQSIAGQGLSGVNEGIAGTLGLPVDLATFGLNLVPRGINALANTDIPTIENPLLGSQWIKERLGDMGAIGEQPVTPGGQFSRRVGESVGAAAIPAGAAGSLGRAGLQLAVGAGGGVGGATAQRAFPGNPVAEMAGEVAGSGATGLGILSGARRQAQRQIENAVPTVPQLREEAGELYRAAEARGIVADPGATQDLADTVRAALGREGTISPTGRISEVYPKAREGMQLIDDYAGATMTPTQMQTVRKVLADGLTSPERTDRRLGGILTDAFDEWSAPLAPELGEARNVASRYLTAEQLQQARELAGARAGQFTGSGFENALRTEYRALDRGAIKGTKRFGDDVTGAIERVSRGTPASNFARGLGKLAPTGVVPFGLGSGLPGMLAMGASGSPTIAGATMLGMSSLGTAGRAAATHMGIRNADLAELTARNGGALPQAELLTPAMRRAFLEAALAQSAKYSTGQ